MSQRIEDALIRLASRTTGGSEAEAAKAAGASLSAVEKVAKRLIKEKVLTRVATGVLFLHPSYNPGDADLDLPGLRKRKRRRTSAHCGCEEEPNRGSFLPVEGESITLQGEDYVVTGVRMFVHKGREEHSISLAKPLGNRTYHVRVDGEGRYGAVSSSVDSMKTSRSAISSALLQAADLLDSLADEDTEEVQGSDLQDEYQAFFKKKLETFGVESPDDLTEEEKKKFFNEIEEEWENGEGPKAEVEAASIKAASSTEEYLLSHLQQKGSGDLTDVIQNDPKLRLVHFSKIQHIAEKLAKKNLIKFDGVSFSAGKVSAGPEKLVFHASSRGKRYELKVFKEGSLYSIRSYTRGKEDGASANVREGTIRRDVAKKLYGHMKYDNIKLQILQGKDWLGEQVLSDLEKAGFPVNGSTTTEWGISAAEMAAGPDPEGYVPPTVIDHFRKAAKEKVEVEEIKGAWYVYGTEIAVLRLFAYYNSRSRNKKTNHGYSKNLRTWYFSLEKSF